MNRRTAIQIDLDSVVPAYRQITDALRVLLVRGTIAPGEKLPPVRRLAIQLGVHFNTVSEAYRQLAEEGWLDLRQGRGATVIERGLPLRSDPKKLCDLRTQLRNLVAQMRSAGAPAKWIAAELWRLLEDVRP
ncbi:MAG TPA: GntR family transcriptional regulator [Bryobacteraceae bacterium]|nr:GntR family transcriptional regulator [Bryobacteraceae bacterium]